MKSLPNSKSGDVWWPLWERWLALDDCLARPEPQIAQLTVAMARAEEDAYREFYERYFNRLLGYLLVLTRGHENAARDALQSAMLRVVKHIKRFDSEEAFWSWLTVLTRTALVDQERKRGRYDAVLARFGREDYSGEETHLLECLRRSMAMLPADELALIEEKYLEGQSVAQIASALGVTEKAVESRLGRIRQKLKCQTLELLK